MREPPADLSESTVIAAINSDYELAIARLYFRPLGHDSHAWVYEAVTSDGRRLFVKARTAVTNEAALAVPHHLVALGIDGVVAPLATAAGGLWTHAGHYAVIVYPFVSGATAMDVGMNDDQWTQYGHLLRQVHDAPVTTDLESLLRRDDFTPDGGPGIRRIDAFLDESPRLEPEQLSVADFWARERTLITDVLGLAQTLGGQVAAECPEQILCHADIHTNNVLVANDGRIWFVDWDETMLAPRERDLMFVIGGIHHSFVNERQTALFGTGYGGVVVDSVALAYYRYSWAVSDIASYGEQVFFRPELGGADRAEAVSRFLSLFQPGSIVDIALSSPLPD